MDCQHRDSDTSAPLPFCYLSAVSSRLENPRRGTAQQQLNRARIARFARPAARATLFAGLLAVLWISSPRAWSQTKLWEFPAIKEANGSPAIGVDGTIYFGSDDWHLYAVHPNGSNYWSFTAGGAVASAPALASDESVYFGALDGWLS